MPKESGSFNESEVATLSCPCGAPLKLKMKSLKSQVVCSECQATLSIVETLDPRTQRKGVGILVNPDAVVIPPKRRAKPPTPSPKIEAPLAGIHNPKCACGARVAVDLASVDSVYTCTWCGACYTALAKKDEGTGALLPLLMPVEVIPLRKDTRKKTRKIPPSKKP
jgi:hypothetical protein